MRSDRALLAAAGFVLLAALPARAQSAPAAPPPAAAVQLLPRTDFTFGWSTLFSADERFDWQGRVGVDFDIVDYGRGRVAFAADYEATLGGERRTYDLNQGFYEFEMTASMRRGAVEIQFLTQHVSRHLVDRELTDAISWNVFGGRVQHRWTPSTGRRVDSRIEAGRFTQPAFVDYRWMARGDVDIREMVSPRLALVGRAFGELIGVARQVAGRGSICGGFVEGGLRIEGRAAAIELFAGYERRVDAFPTDRARVRWTALGFRVTTH